MLKKFLLIILVLQFSSLVNAQHYYPRADSLKLLLNKTNDTAKVLLLADLGFSYTFLQVDTGISYAQRAISLARQLNYKKGEAAGMASYGWAVGIRKLR